MKPEEVRQLLGGYASGTLSEAERKLLFAAALDDQELFDAMADEQALKDLLDDPESRGYLQAVLDEPPVEGRPAVLTPLPAPPPALAPMPMQMRAPAAAASQVAPSELRRARSVPKPEPPPVVVERSRPKMIWGLLAAAGLAAVSVVGILRMTDKGPGPVEMAKNTTPVAVPSPQGPPPQPSVSAPTPRSVPAIAEPRPAVVGKTARKEPEAQVAADKPREQPDKAVSGRVVPDEEKRAQTEAQKPRDEVSAVKAPTPPVPQQQQAAAGAPPPPPAVPQKDSSAQNQQTQSQSPFVVNQAGNQAAPQEQLRLSAPATPGARQLYFAPDRTDNKLSGGPVLEANEKPAPAKKEKAAASGAVGGAGAASRARPVTAAAPSLALALAKQGFAMRYRILRKSAGGSDFVAVAPGARFRVGDEVVVVVEKNSGGVAAIDRVVDGSVTVVPMAIQTDEMARSVPLTVTGPMDLAVVLNRAGSPAGVPVAPPGQKTEVADGMVYAAEPRRAAAAGQQPLVMRVAIRIE